MSVSDFPSQSATGTDLEDRVRTDASNLADTARADLEGVVEEVKHEAASLGEEAKAQLADVTEKAKGMASEQKDLLAEQLGGVSSALGKVAGELETNGEGSARYVRMIADGADKLTSTVKDNDIDDIMAIAQDFGRRQPVAFMGAAALLGFVASRFVVASASRKPEAGSSQYGSPSQYQPPKPPVSPSPVAAAPVSTGSYGQPAGGSNGGF